MLYATLIFFFFLLLSCFFFVGQFFQFCFFHSTRDGDAGFVSFPGIVYGTLWQYINSFVWMFFFSRLNIEWLLRLTLGFT